MGTVRFRLLGVGVLVAVVCLVASVLVMVYESGYAAGVSDALEVVLR